MSCRFRVVVVVVGSSGTESMGTDKLLKFFQKSEQLVEITLRMRRILQLLEIFHMPNNVHDLNNYGLP